MRRDRAPVRYRAERTVQHRDHLPRPVGRLQGGRGHLPDLGYDQDHHPRPDRVQLLQKLCKWQILNIIR